MHKQEEKPSDFLKEHGIKPSYQRMRIYRFLSEHRIHPTVDTIYKALCPEIPTLSKTTVYNTLNLFVEKGIVNVIVIEENETRYDLATTMHGHFKCQQCGEVHDVALEDVEVKDPFLAQCQVEEKHFYFKGICPDCLNKVEN